MQALLTELVFEHSLRIRLKAVAAEGEGSQTSTAPSTPDTASISGAESTLDGAASTTNGDESTVQPSNASVTSKSSVTKDGKRSSEPHKESDTSNLVGKINNLVSTDLDNIVEARDFFLIVFYVPIQIALCIVFLYVILGWRYYCHDFS